MSYTSSPRPLWKDPELKKTDRVITLGGNNGGIVLFMTKEGLYINGYYSGLGEPKKYANMREPLFMSWQDFDMLRADTMRGKPRPKELPERTADREDTPSEEYLDSLPIVTLNGIKFYIDVARQERRPVDFPSQVFNFEKQASAVPK